MLLHAYTTNWTFHPTAVIPVLLQPLTLLLDGISENFSPRGKSVCQQIYCLNSKPSSSGASQKRFNTQSA